MTTEWNERHDTDPEFVARMFYRSLCNQPERIERILNPITSEDHLLRIQADLLIDHTRLYRVARQRAISRGTEDLLEPAFERDFSAYLDDMTEIGRMIAECVPHRYLLTNSREAMCLETEGGRAIVVSEALRYALYFMNLGFGALYGLPDIPSDINVPALIIAARTMRMSEAMDFDLDPRGAIPSDIDGWLSHMTAWQMRFVIGHEFAHHRLDHRGLGLRIVRPITTSNQANVDGREWHSHLRGWDEEYAADLGAISEVEEETARKHLAMAAALFFLYLEFFELVDEGIDPSYAQLDTHPPTAERLRRIVDQFGGLIDIDQEWAASKLNYVRRCAANILEKNKEQEGILTFYGSIYLASWRGKALVDRVDY